MQKKALELFDISTPRQLTAMNQSLDSCLNRVVQLARKDFFPISVSIKLLLIDEKSVSNLWSKEVFTFEGL